ncbi:hypothetical protein L1887_08433 [Cichorium endivia]|nr:hypothetical protein L1887_08433 [Cichorium endivia]
MCGGAILSDIIAPTANRSGRVTADLLWSTDLTKNHSNYFSKPPRSDADDIDDEFEVDFQGFKDQVTLRIQLYNNHKSIASLNATIDQLLLKTAAFVVFLIVLAITGQPLMKFGSGYNVETIFDGSKLGIESHALIPIHFTTILVPSDLQI